jgi:hypothetical protein
MQKNYNAHLSYGLRFSAEESAALRAFIDAAQGNARNIRQ